MLDHPSCLHAAMRVKPLMITYLSPSAFNNGGRNNPIRFNDLTRSLQGFREVMQYVASLLSI
jgi:hypothetical protein